MQRFELAEPQSLEAACALLGDDGEAKAVAGGTALLTLIKHGIFIPKTLVNLNKIGAVSGIGYDAQRGLRIGALASIYDVESSPLVRQHYPVLAPACHVVANIRIRNMTTLGGNLAHGDYQSDPPARLYRAEEIARGKEFTPVLVQELGAEASRAVDTIDDLRGPIDYKRHLVGVLVQRAIGAVIEA